MSDEGRRLDGELIDRAAAILDRGANRIAEEIGDEVAASAILAAWIDFTRRRWGDCCVYEKLRLVGREVGDHLEAQGFILPEELGR